MDLATALAGRTSPGRVVTARLVSIDTTTNRAWVSLYGSLAVGLPFVPGVYSGVATVFVQLDPGGTGQVVLGPCYAASVAEVPPPPPPEPPKPPEPDEPPPADDPDKPPPVLVTASIRPTYSGTYRVVRGDWDRWNTSQHGGRSTLYQGSAYGSGTLIGYAGYGTQVRDLRALRIEKIVVSTPVATGGGTVVLQGEASGTRPAVPSPAGVTASGVERVTFTRAAHASVLDQFRSGGTRALCCVGADYRGTYGTGRASGMSLAVIYQRPQ